MLWLGGTSAYNFLLSDDVVPVPSGPPRKVEVEAVNSTSVKVTWRSPVPNKQHGQIRGYQVHYVKMENGEPKGQPMLKDVMLADAQVRLWLRASVSLWHFTCLLSWAPIWFSLHFKNLIQHPEHNVHAPSQSELPSSEKRNYSETTHLIKNMLTVFFKRRYSALYSCIWVCLSDLKMYLIQSRGRMLRRSFAGSIYFLLY